MDWVMCLLPMAVCFVGVLFSVKVSKKHKRILAAAGVMLFLCVAFGSLAVYRVQKITKPIRESDTLAVAEMNLNSFRGDVEMNDLQTDASTELYQALEEYLGKKLYLPCINQDTFDAGGQDVVHSAATTRRRSGLRFMRTAESVWSTGKRHTFFREERQFIRKSRKF